jgi:hypothetical protein
VLATQLRKACISRVLTLQLLELVGPLRLMARQFRRRRFPALAGPPKIRGRLGEMRRLITQAIGRGDAALAYEAIIMIG